MPTYEYRCEHGHSFEVVHKMSEDPVLVCETCEAPVVRVLFPVAVHFKGKGFYSTDYGSRRRNRELKEAAEGTGKHTEGGGEGGSGSDSGSSESGSGSGSESSSESSASKDSGSSSSSSESKQDKGEGKKKASAPDG